MTQQQHLFETTPALIVLGVDDKSKSHASWFARSEVKQASKAAALMGMATLAVAGDELSALAGKLPQGKLFESGKAFVPFVKGDLFTKLKAHLPQPIDLGALRASAAAGGGEAGEAGPTPNRPKDWSVIAVGDLVLAPEKEGWWEAIVERVVGEMLTLKWRDWPDEPVFVKTREQVALMHPAAKSKSN
jgi:hypothetical protein